MTTDAQRQALRHAAQWFAQLCANPEDAALRARSGNAGTAGGRSMNGHGSS
ncbi:hypothetical protein NWF32_29270 [Pseudomonas qingdaonensis]|nr:hypothetical protein [Pseudomonas qingdaonensis]